MILVVSEFSKPGGQYCYADSISRILGKIGKNQKIRVVNFDCKPKNLGGGWTSFPRINFILGIFQSICVNLHLISKVWFGERPEVIFFVKAENINYRVIRWLAKQKIKLLSFYPDSPFAFFNGSSNQNILLSLPYFEHFFIWDMALEPALSSGGSKSVIYFPFFTDHEIFDKIKVEPEKIYDLCFVGAWDEKREKYLTFVASNSNIKICIAGNLWKDYLRGDSILHKYLQPGEVSFHNMIYLFKQSKIVVNFLKTQNKRTHNMRTFEVPSCKEFLLSEFSQNQRSFFYQGKHAEYFQSEQELLIKTRFFLANEKQRWLIAKNGYLKNKQYSLHLFLKDKIDYFH